MSLFHIFKPIVRGTAALCQAIPPYTIYKMEPKITKGKSAFCLLSAFYLKNIEYPNIISVKILLASPPQNKYILNPSNWKKLFLIFSSSRTFCFITFVSVSDCFSRSFVALCIASIFACNASLTSCMVFSLTSSFNAPISLAMAF